MPFDNGRNGTQEDEDKKDNDVEAVLEKELPAVEGVLVSSPILGALSLRKRELGHAQEVDEVASWHEGSMLAVRSAASPSQRQPWHRSDGSCRRSSRPYLGPIRETRRFVWCSSSRALSLSW